MVSAARAYGPRLRWALAALAAFVQVSRLPAQDYSDICVHENDGNVSAATELQDGTQEFRIIDSNNTQRWFYRNFNVTTFNTAEDYRNVIFNLEPCVGSVLLMVRKTRRCYPNPYSCIDLGSDTRNSADCEWVHFQTEIDGSHDGTPTFYEVPHTSTKYFISVFATENSAYTLTVIADIGAFPRPGGDGKIAAEQSASMQVKLSWDAAYYSPIGVSDTRQYYVYASMLLDTDDRENMQVFLRKDKIMNTVCGLLNNTSEHYSVVPGGYCTQGKCTAIIDGVIPNKRYVFNVVAESYRGYKIAYAGIIMRTDYTVVRKAAKDTTLAVVGSVCGSILALLFTLYFMLLRVYG